MYRFVFEMERPDETSVVYVIPLDISDEQANEFNEKFFEEHDLYDEYSADLESEYGVHDFVSEGDMLLGFSSYEVDPDLELELMKKWRDVLIEIGLNPQEIIQMTERSS